MKKFKMNIFRRTMLLLFSTALICFFANGIVSFFYFKEIYNKSISNGKDVGETMAKFNEGFAVEQAKRSLLSIALERSRRIELGMKEVRKDAESLALQIRRILSNPEKYKDVILPNLKEKTIHSCEVYISYATELERKGISNELKHEIMLASNIADLLRVIANHYKGYHTTSYICSKNGYFICVETLLDEKGIVSLLKEFMENYEPRTRPWYIAAKEANRTIITDIYKSMEGYPAVSLATPYYDANGNFAGVAAVDADLSSLYKLIAEDSLGNTGINFTMNDKGEVILSSVKTGTFAVTEEHKDLRTHSDGNLAKEAFNMAEGRSGVSRVSVDGKEYYLAYAPMPTLGWSFGTLIERNEVIQPAGSVKKMILSQSNDFVGSMRSFYLQHLNRVVFCIVAILALLFYVSFKDSRKFVNPIVELTNNVKEIAKGNLDKKLDVKSGDEIETLADSVNLMTSDLKQYMENFSKVTAEKERIATELNVAKNIQAGLLPKVEAGFSQRPEFELAAFINPAKEVGGDFYDFYLLDENHLVVTIADVSGKGVGAALFMAISKTVLKNFAVIASSAYSEGREPDLADIMEKANIQLCENNKENMFVTVFMGILNLKNGEFSYVNAGHNPPLVRYKSEGEFSYIRNIKKNRIIGVSKKSQYQEHRLRLSLGDMLFFYTDGVTEAMNEQRELFNESSLKTALDTIPDGITANEMLSTVISAIKSHVGNAEQSDDMTMLGLVYKNQANS